MGQGANASVLAPTAAPRAHRRTLSKKVQRVQTHHIQLHIHPSGPRRSTKSHLLLA